MLQWAQENGCDWDSWTCVNAAQGGHLNVLQWAVENGCNINVKACKEKTTDPMILEYLENLNV